MKIYSDTLITQDLYRAARGLPVAVFYCEPIVGARVRAHGWTVSLTGSSPYWSQTSFCENHRAATWKEHGLWMAELYKLDPKARIGWYKTLDDFLTETYSMHERSLLWGSSDRRAARFEAPWLEDAELIGLTAPNVATDSVQFGTLQENGTLTNVREIRNADILACPFVILDPSHYREDGSCKCNEPTEQARMIREWGYSPADFEPDNELELERLAAEGNRETT